MRRTRTGAAMTFSRAVMWGNRLKRWKTMPTCERCLATSLALISCRTPFFSRRPTSSPPTHNLPELIFSRRLMHRSSVDLPPPEGPSKTKVSWGMTSRSMPFNTSSLPNDFQTCSTLTMGCPTPRSGDVAWATYEPASDMGLSPLDPPQSSLLRCLGLLVAETLAKVGLEVVLPNGQDSREEEVPETGHHDQRHDLEGLRVDVLHPAKQLETADHSDQRGRLEHADRLVAERRDNHPHCLRKHDE